MQAGPLLRVELSQASRPGRGYPPPPSTAAPPASGLTHPSPDAGGSGCAGLSPLLFALLCEPPLSIPSTVCRQLQGLIWKHWPARRMTAAEPPQDRKVATVGLPALERLLSEATSSPGACLARASILPSSLYAVASMCGQRHLVL